jgi:cysteine desulfurase family protein (TIGR01976 family)
MPFDINAIRNEFPSLAVTDDGRPRVYLDNPAGTQVPRRVIDAISDCLLRANANLGGYFSTTRLAGAIVEEAHAAMRDFLNARDAGEIVYGQNSTSLVLHISRSIGREMAAGDEIVLTRMDHDANVGPWLMLAEDRGLTVKWWDFDTTSWELDFAQLDTLLTPRTKLVAVNHASNALGTITDVAEVARRAHAVGAWVFVDAVQSAPHMALDVQALGCDFLVCSPYKFYGPHQGVLWGRREHLERMRAYRVRPAGDQLPGKYETGTLSHEGMAGTAAAVEHFAWIGRTLGGADGAPRRAAIEAGFHTLKTHEDALTRRLLEGLATIPDLQVLGITDTARAARRVPTVSFVWTRHAPADIARALAAENIFVWSGHNYAVEIYRTLGREAEGGLRIGFAQYNTATEIDRLLQVLHAMC